MPASARLRLGRTALRGTASAAQPVSAARKSARRAGAPGRAATSPAMPGALLQAVAALLWLPQAGLIAFAVQQMAQGAAAVSIAPMAGALFALGVARALLDAAGARLLFRAARRQVSALRAEVAQALAARSPLDGRRAASGAAASAVAEQAEAIVPYLTRFVPARLRMSIVSLAIFAAVLPFAWIPALLLLVAAPLIPLFMALVGWRAKLASEEQLARIGGMNAFLLDRLRGLATIRALGAVDLTARRLRADAEDVKTRTMSVLRIAFLSSAVLELFSALGVAMVAVYVGFHLLGTIGFGAWGAQLSLGQGLFILLLAPAFFEPLRDFSAAWHDRASGLAAFAALGALSEEGLPLPGAGTQHNAPAPLTGAPDVRLRDVSFHHAGRPEAGLSHVSLTVRPGERVALLGPSGSGKTTLLSLVAGLMPAEAGQIAIGGRELDEASAAGLRRGMAWVGQKPHIFAGSLAANVTLGRDGLGAPEVAAALAAAAWPPEAGVRMEIGEGGLGLSGGEGRRLALARAAVAPEARLILADEPTAHLDAETAADVTERLLTLSEGRTLIVATHDPVLAARMDRVIQIGAAT